MRPSRSPRCQSAVWRIFITLSIVPIRGDPVEVSSRPRGGAFVYVLLDAGRPASGPEFEKRGRSCSPLGRAGVVTAIISNRSADGSFQQGGRTAPAGLV